MPLATAGLSLGARIGLGAPLAAGLVSDRPGSWARLRRVVSLAGSLGVGVGAALLAVRWMSAPYLPQELPAFGHRGVIGGLAVSLGAAVAEEVWFRLGLMTLLVWGATRLAGHEEVRPFVAWSVYGWCFWRRGLVAAIIAHLAVDVVLHVLPAIV